MSFLRAKPIGVMPMIDQGEQVGTFLWFCKFVLLTPVKGRCLLLAYCLGMKFIALSHH